MEGTSNGENTGDTCEMGSACKKVIPGYDSMEKFVENGFKCLINATKSSNRLPFGKARDFYESYPSFHALMQKEADKVLSQLSGLMRHAGYKANIQRRDDDDKTEMVIEANDSILGKVGQILDQMSGICQYPEPKLLQNTVQSVSGSWNVNEKVNRLTTAQVLNNVFKKTKTIEKPQLSFKDTINNDRNSIFEPRIKYKHNMLKPLAILEEMDESGNIHYSHPYQFELNHFVPSKEELAAVEPIPYKPMEETPLHFIEKVEDIQSVIDDCKKYKEIAVDLEHHSYRSFQGFTCLLQISTRDIDYIIDTLILRNDLEGLNEIFTDPEIVKIFHGADLDLLWLQRDLGIYVVNLFDTYEASKLLGFPRLSLAFLLQKFCNVNVDKHFQLADWRVRPLPDELIEYARGDTHYLMYIYDNLKNILIEKGNGKPNYLESVIANSTSKCLSSIYEKPVWNEDGYLDLYHRSKKLFDNRQKFALKCLYEWRDNIARTYDESYGYVLPNHMMLQISEALPREAQGILACCNPIPPLVKKYLLTLHQMILKAREQPLVEPVFEERQFYRAVGENNLIPDNLLHCPHDLNHEGEFRDDLPVLISENICKTERDEDIVCRNPIVDVFEKPATERGANSSSFNKTVLLTPYERYKLAKPFNEAKESAEAEAQKMVTSNKEKIQMMEVNEVGALLKKESDDFTVVKTESLRKRKAKEMAEKQAAPSKKVKVEKDDDSVKNPLVNNSNAVKDESSKKEEKKNRPEVEPFNYSSVNFNKYQTYVESGSRRNSRPQRGQRKFGRRRK